jgi:hypothetical protein
MERPMYTRCSRAFGSYGWVGPLVSRCGLFRWCGNERRGPSKYLHRRGVDRGGIDFPLVGRCGRLGGGAPLAEGTSSHCAAHCTHAPRRSGERRALTFPSPLASSALPSSSSRLRLVCSAVPFQIRPAPLLSRAACCRRSVPSPHGVALAWVWLR